jgi:hypothetical protein
LEVPRKIFPLEEIIALLRRIGVLTAQGWVVGKDRVQRNWHREGLKVPLR